MHGLYADDVVGSRRNRFEEREPEAYTPPRENGAHDMEPEGSPLLIQPDERSRRATVPSFSKGQQQKQPPHSNLHGQENGQELSAATIEKFRLDSGGPRASPVPSSSTGMGGSYRDHEMRLHQSIIYNRTRLKLDQHQQIPQPASPPHTEAQERLSPSHVLTPNQSPASHGGRHQNQQIPPPPSAIHPMHRPNAQQQYHTQDDGTNDEDTGTAFSVPFDQKHEKNVPNTSSYSHSTRPVASREYNQMHHENNDDHTMLSGYSKPFDEKTEFMNEPDTNYGRHTSNPQVDRQSPGGEHNSSAFWKHASPPPVINHQMAADRFKLPPPRLSDPAAYQKPIQYPPNNGKPQKRQATSTLQDRVEDTSYPQQSSLRQSPVNVRSMDIPENNRSWEQHTDRTRPSSRLDLNLTNEASARHVLQNEKERKNEEDDDSLFGNLKDDSQHKAGDSRGKSLNKKKNRRSSRMYAEDFDDSSIDTPAVNASKVSASPASLSLRAQEAWKRNRHQATRSPQPPIAEEEDPNPAARNKVSFGAVDTVHHYPNPNDVAENETTISAASAASEYTKSMESEVEDIFKDIFLIGDAKDSKPGKRRVKPKSKPLPEPSPTALSEPSPKPLSEPSQDESTVDSLTDADTLNTYTDDEEDGTKGTGGGSRESSTAKGKKQVSKARNVSPDSEKLRKKKRIPEDEEDPVLQGVWNIMETSVGAIGGALGLLAPDDDDTISAYSSQVTERYEETEDDDEPSTISTPPKKKPEKQLSFFESLLGTPTSSPQEKQRSNVNASPTSDRQSAPSLQQDLRLIQLAKEAARMQHKMRGLQYDESKEVDIVKEIKFVVADLELPMGVVFQENQGGCWITKIMPTGSAAKSAIRVGDQLAAIDGVSAINMTVDQVADAVRQKKSVFELTLLRYTGKLRPIKGSKKVSKRASQNVSRTSNSSKQQRSKPDVATASKKADSQAVVASSARTKPSIRQPEKQVEQSKEATKIDAPQDRKKTSSTLFGKKSAKSSESEATSGEKKKRFGIFGRKKK